MVRLGKYTGHVYKDDEIKTMQECGVCITNEEAEDDQFINDLKQRNAVDCLLCGGGCPESMKGKD